MFRLYLYIIILSLSVNVYSQNDSLDVIPTNLLEEFVENIDSEEFDYNTIFEQLEVLRRNPLNLNNASFDELKQLIFLNEIQIQNILEHKAIFGNFNRFEELQVVPSLDIQTINQMKGLVKVNGTGAIKFNLKDQLSAANQTLFLKYERILEDKKGYLPKSDGSTNYLGDQNYYYLRYRLNSGNRFLAGFTAERDAGEEFFTGSNKNGFDFYSAFIYAKDVTSRIKYLCLGDYSVSLGQGLILHNDFGNGKSSYVMDVKKGGRPLRPYSSVNEVNFFRGIAANFKLSEDASITLFGSNNFLGGSVLTDTIENNDFDNFSSIRVDGLHRTQTEIASKNKVTQQNLGTGLKYNFGRLELGANLLFTRLSASLQPDNQLYKRYNFRGDQLTNGSIDYSYRYYNYNFFGEIAISNPGGKAILSGLIASLSSKVDVSVVYRKYDKNYHVLNGNAFSEGTNPINEEGLYTGIQVNLNKSWRISSYFDIWRHPWLRFRKDAPSTGKEFLAKVEYTKKRKFSAYVQYRFEQKQENVEIEGKLIDGLAQINLHRLRFHFGHKLTKELELRNRFEYSYYKKHTLESTGYLIYQDIIYRPEGSGFSCTARYALFDTDDFNSRIYAYENDILYEFLIPFYQNRGSRFYVNLRQKLNRNMTGEFRYARTTYSNIDEISSGNEQILGNKKSEIKAQLRINF